MMKEDPKENPPNNNLDIPLIWKRGHLRSLLNVKSAVNFHQFSNWGSQRKWVKSWPDWRANIAICLIRP